MSKLRIDKASSFYSEMALGIDNKVLSFRYDTIKKYFIGSSCLELGPADGIMTQMLISDFDKITLVDGSKTLLDKIPKYPNVEKVISLFEDYEPTQKFSTIIMEHVLEHIEYPIRVLEKVKNWLQPNGVLIIGVPNALSFHRMAAVKMNILKTEYTLNERDNILGHYRVYDIDTLTNDITKAGLTIAHKGGVFLKTVSYAQIEKDWNDSMINAYYHLGKSFPRHCAEIFAVCKNDRP